MTYTNVGLEEKNAKYFVRTFKFLKVTYTNLGLEEKNAKYFVRTFKFLKVTYTDLGLEKKKANILSELSSSLTLFRLGYFGAPQGWGGAL